MGHLEIKEDCNGSRWRRGGMNERRPEVENNGPITQVLAYLGLQVRSFTTHCHYWVGLSVLFSLVCPLLEGLVPEQTVFRGRDDPVGDPTSPAHFSRISFGQRKPGLNGTMVWTIKDVVTWTQMKLVETDGLRTTPSLVFVTLFLRTPWGEVL